MKIQSWVLATVFAVLTCSATAQAVKPTTDGNTAEQAAAAMAKRAEALSEDQIKQSHNIGALNRLAQLYNAQQDLQRFTWTLERLTKLMPNSGDLRLQLAIAYAKAGDKTKTYDTLIHMQIQGFGYDIAKDPRFEKVHGTKVWDYLVANLQVNSKPFGEGKVAFDLPKGDYLFDALAWDPQRQQLLAGSARQGTIYRVDAHGKLTPFIVSDKRNGPWGVYAMGVDAHNHLLYVASAATAVFHDFDANNANQCALFAFDLKTGKLVRKYAFAPATGRGVLTALAVSADGQVYVADGPHRRVYRLDGGELKLLLRNPRLTNISALTVSGDGRTLYLADFALGVFGYDLTKSKPFELRYDANSLVLGGIVDMHCYDGTLVIIENGMVPKRVMRLQLSKDGRSIGGAMPLDVAQPKFGELGRGAVAGKRLYFVANRQDELYDSHGVLADTTALAPTRIYRSNLRFAWGHTGVGMSSIPVKSGKPAGAKKNVKPSAGHH